MSATTFFWLCLTWSAIAILILLTLLISKVRAPYGRHIKEGWGKLIPNKWGWFIMELPALIIMPALVISSSNQISALSWLLVFLWGYHYANRTLIFPFKIKTSEKMMPLSIVFFAFSFNCINGWLNGYYLGFMAPSEDSVFTFRVMVGLVLFISGTFINQKSDTALIALRSKSTEYQIPQKGLFKYVSCPNHLGEIIEWIGFAVIAWNLAALSFAIWTICNLVPRALNHHAWYKEHFSNYPEERKAIIPFIL